MSRSGYSSDDDHTSSYYYSQRGDPGAEADEQFKDIKAGDLDNSSLRLPHAHTESRSAVPLDSQPQDSSSKSSKNDQRGYYADPRYSSPYSDSQRRQDGYDHLSPTSLGGYPAYSPDGNMAYGPLGQGRPQVAPRQRISIACRYCRKRKIRCSGYQNAPGGRCQNCVRMGQECIFQPVSSSSSTAFIPVSAVPDTAPAGTTHRGTYGQPLVPVQHRKFPPIEKDQQDERRAFITKVASNALVEERSTETNVSTWSDSQEPFSPQVSQKRQQEEEVRVKARARARPGTGAMESLSSLSNNDLDGQILRHPMRSYSEQEIVELSKRELSKKIPGIDGLSQQKAWGSESETARNSAHVSNAPFDDGHQESQSKPLSPPPSSAAGIILHDQDHDLLPQLWSSWEDSNDFEDPVTGAVIRWDQLIKCLKDSKPPGTPWDRYCKMINQPTNMDDALQQAQAFKSLVRLESEHELISCFCPRLVTSWLSQAYQSARRLRRARRSTPTPMDQAPFEETYLVQIFDIAEDLFQTSFSYQDFSAIGGLLAEACKIAMNTTYERDLEACIRIIGAATARWYFPNAYLISCVKVLASSFRLVPRSRDKAWDVLSRLLEARHGDTTFRIMMDSTFPEDESGSQCLSYSKAALKVIERLLIEDTMTKYPAITLFLLTEGIAGIVERSSSIKIYNGAAGIIHSLFDFGEGEVHPLVRKEGDWSACFNIIIRCYQKHYAAIDNESTFDNDPGATSDLKQKTLLLIATLADIRIKSWVEPSQEASIVRFLVDVSNFQSPKRNDPVFDSRNSNTSHDPKNAELGGPQASEIDFDRLNSHQDQNIQNTLVANDGVRMPFTRDPDEDLAQGFKTDSTDGDSIDDATNLSIDDSDIESIFSTGSLPSSQSSQGGLFHLVVLEWAELLVHDPELQLLYPTALSKVGPERFQRNFARFLQTYGKKLKEEASNDLQHEVAAFVRQSARRTALEIRRVLKPDSHGLSTPLSLTMEVSRKVQVSRWLESHGARPEGPLLETTETAPNNDLSDMSDSEQSETFERSSFRTLAETKNFMVSSAAFLHMQQAFRAWLEIDKESNPKGTKEPQSITIPPQDEVAPNDNSCDKPDTPVELESPPMAADETFSPLPKEKDNIQVTDTDGNNKYETQDNGTLSVWSRLRFRIACMLSPPAPGYQRVSYICGCGQLSYLDLKELSRGGVERIQRKLIKSADAVRRRPQHALDSTAPERPPPAYINSNESAHRPRVERHLNPLPSGSSPWDGEADNDEDSDRLTLGRRSDLAGDLQYLLLCVHTRTSTTLVHVEVGRFSNDQYLFEELRRAYQRAREENEWKLSMIVPFWLQTIFQAVSKQLPSIPGCEKAFSRLSRTVRQISLHRIASGDFVRFQLVPIGERCCPTWFKARDFPPPSEVIAKRYLYEPVPMDDVEFADIPLAHLLQPGPHLDTFWKSVFPKKLCEELRRPAMSGQRVVGWGVRINETLNWSVVLLSIFLLLLLIGVIVVVYSAMTSDNSSAFGLGAFLMAIFTAYITYQYFAWREKM